MYAERDEEKNKTRKFESTMKEREEENDLV